MNEMIKVFRKHGYNKKAVKEYLEDENTVVNLNTIKRFEKYIKELAEEYEVEDYDEAVLALEEFDMITM